MKRTYILRKLTTNFNNCSSSMCEPFTIVIVVLHVKMLLWYTVWYFFDLFDYKEVQKHERGTNKKSRLLVYLLIETNTKTFTKKPTTLHKQSLCYTGLLLRHDDLNQS